MRISRRLYGGFSAIMLSFVHFDAAYTTSANKKFC